MRVAFFGQTGPYAPPALRQLAGAAGFELVLVVEGRKGYINRRGFVIERPRPRALPDGENLTDLGIAAGLPVLITTDVNAPAVVGRIASYEPDWIVCVGFDRLFGRPLLAVASTGGINCHPSRLPKLRGPAPIYWAVKAGARSLAVTLHGLDPGEDHGPVYAQESFVLPRRATTDDIYRLAGTIAGRMLVSSLGTAAAGVLVGVAQDHRAASRAPRPKAEDAYFDPAQWDCEHLLDFVNVAPFCRAAWTRLGDEVFFVRRALGCEIGKRMPAQYLQRGSTLIVQCRDGVAEVEIQI